jgi:hemoglobin
MNRSWTIKLATIALALGLSACANMMAPPPGPPPPPPMAAAPAPPPSLYQRLGGQPAIVAVVDDFVGRVAADRRINRYFRHTNIPRLKESVVNQICQATGGPCVYQGPPMRVVHHRMHVTDAAFKAFVQGLIATLNKFNVPQPEQQELLGILGPLKADIVNV